MKKTYTQKLKDPRWQKKRLIILERDEFTCLLCGDDSEELHVHHTRYVGEPWECPNEHLQTLCKTCHSIVSNLKNSEIQYISKGVNHAVAIEDDELVHLIRINTDNLFTETIVTVNRRDDDIINFAGFITFSEFTRRGMSVRAPKSNCRF